MAKESIYHILQVRVTAELKDALTARAKQMRLKTPELARFIIAERLANYDLTHPIVSIDASSADAVIIDDESDE